MKKTYCFDTSGISNPLMNMPEDIYASMWKRFNDVIRTGCVAVTREIYDEMKNIGGTVGECIKQSKGLMVLEVGDSAWDWSSYVHHAREMQITYQCFISEFNGSSPRTICLNDISIIALSKTLSLPVVSMEVSVVSSSTKRRIPDICRAEDIEHIDFNAFLRREKIRL